MSGFKVGEETVFVVGMQGTVDALSDDTITINGIELPRRLDHDGGVRYLSVLWPEDLENSCSREHCDNTCEPSPLAEDLQDDLDRLHELIRDEHMGSHADGAMRFCSVAVCREATS